jgi:hypothetical protein
MRKTEKGRPKYQDARELDVSILTGAEDLVRVLADGRSQRHSPVEHFQTAASSARY